MQTDQPADWGKERGEAMAEGLREKGMMGMERNRRMDAMDLAFRLFVPRCV